MNGVLADTSVWIAYLKGRPEDKRVADALDYLLSGDEAVVNDVILTELLPAMQARGEMEAAALMGSLRCPALEIDWKGLRDIQTECLRAGINKVGIPDLIIAQQAVRLDMPLFSLDRHFELIAQVLPLCLWPRQHRSAKRKS